MPCLPICQMLLRTPTATCHPPGFMGRRPPSSLPRTFVGGGSHQSISMSQAMSHTSNFLSQRGPSLWGGSASWHLFPASSLPAVLCPPWSSASEVSNPAKLGRTKKFSTPTAFFKKKPGFKMGEMTFFEHFFGGGFFTSIFF